MSKLEILKLLQNDVKKARDHLWRNLGAISSNQMRLAHSEYVECFTDQVGVARQAAGNWEEVGQVLAQCTIIALQAAACLPNVNPVGKVIIKLIVYNQIRETFSRQKSGLQWLYK